MRTSKKLNKVKLTSIPVITRRLFRFASQSCRDKAGNKCEVCGCEGKIDCHHIITRNIKDSILKFDMRNLIALCPSHHKFGYRSAHLNPVFFINWLLANRRSDFDWLLAHDEYRCNLQDRANLTYIEWCLTNNKEIDYAKLNKK